MTSNLKKLFFTTVISVFAMLRTNASATDNTQPECAQKLEICADFNVTDLNPIEQKNLCEYIYKIYNERELIGWEIETMYNDLTKVEECLRTQVACLQNANKKGGIEYNKINYLQLDLIKYYQPSQNSQNVNPESYTIIKDSAVDKWKNKDKANILNGYVAFYTSLNTIYSSMTDLNQSFDAMQKIFYQFTALTNQICSNGENTKTDESININKILNKKNKNKSDK